MKTEFQRELDDIFSELDPKVEADARLALDIASQFTALRQRRGMTQAELAEKLGKSQQAISKIENPSHGGHNLARLKEAVEALGATLDVTLVPREDLDAYRAADVAKPALSSPGANVVRATSQEGPVQNLRTENSAYDAGLVYGAVFETIVNRVRIQGLIEALIDKGIMSQTEWDNRFRRVAEERLTSYASTIVSDEDAESIKDAVLHSGGTVSSGSEGAEAAR